MEGDGPIMGQARPSGFIAMGQDLAAVDATCARVMGIDPAKVVYLDAAGHFLGNISERRIDQRGDAVRRFRRGLLADRVDAPPATVTISPGGTSRVATDAARWRWPRAGERGSCSPRADDAACDRRVSR